MFELKNECVFHFVQLLKNRWDFSAQSHKRSFQEKGKKVGRLRWKEVESDLLFYFSVAYWKISHQSPWKLFSFLMLTLWLTCHPEKYETIWPNYTHITSLIKLQAQKLCLLLHTCDTYVVLFDVLFNLLQLYRGKMDFSLEINEFFPPT